VDLLGGLPRPPDVGSIVTAPAWFDDAWAAPLLLAKATKSEYSELRDRLTHVARSDPLYELSPEEVDLVWRCREHITSEPTLLPKFLLAVNWASGAAVAEAYHLMDRWVPPSPLQALQLLDSHYPDPKVRAYAVERLEEMDEAELGQYLLQLSQVLKYELFTDSALARFLLRRALRHPRVIGHQLFWLLKGEMHISEVAPRYGVFLEQYLRSCGGHRTELGH